MVSYADTSFLIPLYVPEAVSGQARLLASRLDTPLPLHALLQLEFRNALNLGMKQGRVNIGERDRSCLSLEADLASGIFVQAPFPIDEVCRQARRLSDRLAPDSGVRSLDLLQIASALNLGATEFLTFDKRQAEAAKLAGLRTRI